MSIHDRFNRMFLKDRQWMRKPVKIRFAGGIRRGIRGDIRFICIWAEFYHGYSTKHILLHIWVNRYTPLCLDPFSDKTRQKYPFIVINREPTTKPHGNHSFVSTHTRYS
jgi:hypothetical protein